MGSKMEVTKNNPTQGKGSYYDFFKYPSSWELKFETSINLLSFWKGSRKYKFSSLWPRKEIKNSNEFTIRNLCKCLEAIILTEKNPAILNVRTSLHKFLVRQNYFF